VVQSIHHWRQALREIKLYIPQRGVKKTEILVRVKHAHPIQSLTDSQEICIRLQVEVDDVKIKFLIIGYKAFIVKVPKVVCFLLRHLSTII